MPTLRLAVLGLITWMLPAQVVTLAEGPANDLQIVMLAESNMPGPGTVVLQNVEVLPVEVTGRTLAHESDATRSRRVVRDGRARVELPGGGRLFRYQRLGGQFWGFLHVAADGAARVVLEQPGVGAVFADPFLDRIGVADDGLHAAIGLLGGGLHVVKLDGSLFASTGRPDRLAVPVSTETLPASVMVGATHVFYQSSLDEVFRCALADGAIPVDVTPAPVPNGIFKDEMCLSRDGQHLVFLYGPQQQQRLWHVDTAGVATVLPPPPSKYEEPGYLPDGPGEPAMLLDDAGTRLFYIDAALRDELHLLDLAGVLPDLQITESAIFQPYIGSHILPKFHGPLLAVAIGDPGQMDWFRATLASGGGTVSNLTGTGSMVQPFPSGQLDPVQAAEAGGRLLITEQGQGTMTLRRLDPASGANTIVQQDLLAPPVAGSATAGVADLLVRGSGGDRIYRGLTANLFAQTPTGVLLTPPVHGPLLSATWVHLSIGWGIVAFYLPDGTILSGPIEYGVEQLAMTAAGGVVVVGNPLRYLAPGVTTLLNRPAVPVRFCMSGAGG